MLYIFILINTYIFLEIILINFSSGVSRIPAAFFGLRLWLNS